MNTKNYLFQLKTWYPNSVQYIWFLYWNTGILWLNPQGQIACIANNKDIYLCEFYKTIKPIELSNYFWDRYSGKMPAYQ